MVTALLFGLVVGGAVAAYGSLETRFVTYRMNVALLFAWRVDPGHHGVTIEELARHAKCSWRTARRYLQLLAAGAFATRGLDGQYYLTSKGVALVLEGVEGP